ncbi:CopD family protein [Georhizobium profundi]|nr:CopD family protein [Georhizobium profundi]
MRHARLRVVGPAVIWLLIFATSLGGTDNLPGTVYALLFSSRLGPFWLVRLSLATLLLFFAITGRPQLVASAALIMLLAEGGSGHGAGNGLVGPSLHAVHAVSAAAWIGGLVALMRVLAAGSTGRIPRRVVADLLEQFSRMGILIVLLLAATGAAMTWLILGDIPSSRNDYSQILLLKIALFALIVGLALINRFLLLPRLSSSTGGPALRKLSAAIVLEQIAGAGVLLAVAVLGPMDPNV